MTSWDIGKIVPRKKFHGDLILSARIRYLGFNCFLKRSSPPHFGHFLSVVLPVCVEVLCFIFSCVVGTLFNLLVLAVGGAE